MKTFLVFLFSVASLASAHAQRSCGIIQAWAYFTVSMPGTQMVDENGNPVRPVPNVNRLIYVECMGGKKPVIGDVWYNTESYKVSAIVAMPAICVTGKRNSDEKEIRLKARKGNRIWKLELQQVSDKPQSADACTKIRLQALIAGKTCTYRLPAAEVQLYTPPAY